MRIYLFLLTLLASSTLFAQDAGPLALIPAPASLTVNGGSFTLPSTIVIEAQDQNMPGSVLDGLKTQLTASTGYTATVTSQPATNATIRLVLHKTPEPTLGAEAYYLSVAPGSGLIRANQPAGIFYGIQTLLQLLPAAIESKVVINRSSWQAPCVTITDYPRFGSRGLMLCV